MGKCIKVNALFELVALVQKDIDAEQGSESSAELDITSHAIQAYFTDERHPIVPWKYPRYQHFFVDGEPEIALTYQWSTSFRKIKAYLDPHNLATHNQATVDPDPSIWERLYLMSFLWVILGPMQRIPLDVGEKTIFVDIMINDQTNIDTIAQELDKAEGYYKKAKDHLIVGSDGVLDRAWCLYEIALRREAQKRSHVLFLHDAEAVAVEQVKTSKLSVSGFLSCMFWKNVGLGIGFRALSPFFSCCLDLKFLFNGHFALSSRMVTDETDESFMYYEKMKAFKDSDKEGIRSKIDQVFGRPVHFNAVVGAATVQCGFSRILFNFLLWMEAIIFCISIPIHVAFGSLGLVLGLMVMISWRICCICNKRAHQQFVGFSADVQNSELNQFWMNVLNFLIITEMFSIIFLVGFLMLLPVSMILCSVWLADQCALGAAEKSAIEAAAPTSISASGTLVVDSGPNDP